MESGRISNTQISASSTYSDGRWTPQQSRLNSDDNGWTPNVDSNKEYLQVPFQPLSSSPTKCGVTLLNCPLTIRLVEFFIASVACGE